MPVIEVIIIVKLIPVNIPIVINNWKKIEWYKKFKMMKVIALFPGTDAIEDAKVRKVANRIKEVRAKVLLADQIISKSTGQSLGLTSYMNQENDRSLAGFQKLVICSLATQVAIFEKYTKAGKHVDMLMGLSLGDIARSVVSNLCTFEEAVLLLYKFTELSETVAPGGTMQIFLDKPIYEMESVLQLEEHDLEISVLQNERFFLVAGGIQAIKKWMVKIAKPNNIVCKLLYPFPLHSKLMNPVSQALAKDIENTCSTNQTMYPIFSTVFAKELKKQEEIINDSKLNINSTLYFTDTINNIVSKYKKVKFVNIGPANTLLRFIEKMNLNLPNIELEDWFKDNNLGLEH